MCFDIRSHQTMNGTWTSIIFLGQVALYKSKGNYSQEQAESNAWYEFGYHMRRLIKQSVAEVASEMQEDGE